MSLRSDSEFQERAHALSLIVRSFGAKGWVAATSSNFSFVHKDLIAISISGRNKARFTPDDLMLVDHSNKAIEPVDGRSSAEALIHTKLYEKLETKVVFHTHSPKATVLSRRFAKKGEIAFKGYEVVKAMPGFNSHEQDLVIPILPNSQDMESFSKALDSKLDEWKNPVAFLIEGHGLYTWADDLASAERHVEACEFLLDCFFQELTLNATQL